ncbi:hypothetical protein IWZ00DRAFT_335365 [Phyllosticta capitalensis]|uniref:uncharacterized protein n=1 Tax=Phyllosticta capitalensis TaxID=121624 RepID=UPI00313039B5
MLTGGMRRRSVPQLRQRLNQHLRISRILLPPDLINCKSWYEEFQFRCFQNDPYTCDSEVVQIFIYDQFTAPSFRSPANILLQMDSLPSKISYSLVEIESPKGKKLMIPRRELFDVRLQLMAEDDADSSAPTGLDDSDIKTNVYEGGYKSWECSIDLAKLLLDRGPRKDIDDLCRVDHVIELGCGTAIPTLILFHYALTQSLPLYFTLADYNASVLRLVTLPNLILTWASTLDSSNPTAAPFSEDSPNPFHDSEESHGDLYITPELTSAFLEALSACPLTLSFISGSWAPADAFLNLTPSAEQMNTLLLGSETIYSPSALRAFTETCVGLLKRVRLGKAMVAAKKFYFGVGGGVDAFKEECAARGAVAAEIENSGVEMGEGGVRRCLLEVQMM